ncbi:hypothetical protein EMWEY_00013450 [Eimeria maxima]|uniref:Transmembrane protein n=1 Tax=Eimeria maxima TaxID=5804 RepID=U6M4R4_EIMMA|nr:hypothetical protein EMWEY_00013450 [Eimeria maxima]CDJ58038.1 hypothetical protein EMWEY_00013450 [Eimeria maxima]
MGRLAVSGRLHLMPFLGVLFGLVVNSLVPNASSRQLHGVAARFHSLSPPAQLDHLKPFASGSFLSTAARPRSTSLTFASPEESGASDEPSSKVRHRSQSLGSGRQAPSGVWKSEGGRPNMQQPQTQNEQAQQQKRRHSRFQRLRNALKRLGGAAKEKLKRLWQSIKRGASRAKRAARQAVTNLYNRFPRLRKSRKAPEGAEVIASSGLAGAGLASAAPHLGPGEDVPEGVKTLEEEEVSTPPSPDNSTTSTATEETAATPTPEGPYRSKEVEEWFEAPTAEDGTDTSEEWHDAVLPGGEDNANAGNFNIFLDATQDLVVQTWGSIAAGKQIIQTDKSFDAELLRVTLALALVEDRIAKAMDQTEEYCWLPALTTFVKRQLLVKFAVWKVPVPWSFLPTLSNASSR